MGGGMTMGLGAGCDGGEGNSRPVVLLFMMPASVVIGVGIASAGVQVGLLLAGVQVPATMGYVGGSSGPCDCLLRMSNV